MSYRLRPQLAICQPRWYSEAEPQVSGSDQLQRPTARKQRGGEYGLQVQEVRHSKTGCTKPVGARAILVCRSGAETSRSNLALVAISDIPEYPNTLSSILHDYFDITTKVSLIGLLLPLFVNAVKWMRLFSFVYPLPACTSSPWKTSTSPAFSTTFSSLPL